MSKLCLNPSFWGSVTWEHAFREGIELCRAVQCKTITWLRFVQVYLVWSDKPWTIFWQKIQLLSNSCPISVIGLSTYKVCQQHVPQYLSKVLSMSKRCPNKLNLDRHWTYACRFVHTLSKKICSTNTLTGIGHWHPEFVHSLSNNFLISPNTTFLLVDKVWTKIGHWTNSGHTLNMDKQLTKIVFVPSFNI